MAEKNICPQCGAPMNVKTIGLMRDKVLSCSYCGCVIDIPDDYQESRTVEEVMPDGTRRKILIQRKRLDAGQEKKARSNMTESHFETKSTVSDYQASYTLDPKTGKWEKSESRKFKDGKGWVDRNDPRFKEYLGQMQNMIPPDLLDEFKAQAEDPTNSNAFEDKQIYQMLKDIAEGKIDEKDGVSVEFLKDNKPLNLKGTMTLNKTIKGPHVVITRGEVNNINDIKEIKLISPSEQKSTGVMVLKWIGMGALVWIAVKIVLTLVLRMH